MEVKQPPNENSDEDKLTKMADRNSGGGGDRVMKEEEKSRNDKPEEIQKGNVINNPSNGYIPEMGIPSSSR